ncbi:MAG: hypothetical protein J6S67_17270 [Methanobrevibacter sp.]|nr:hypothetical protein [Methanobrevibacter sp.]
MRRALEAKADLKEAKEKIVSDTQARYKRQVKVSFASGSLYTLKYFLDLYHETGRISSVEIQFVSVKKKTLLYGFLIFGFPLKITYNSNVNKP